MTDNHAHFTNEQGHRSYLKGCRCDHCRLRHSNWMVDDRARRAQQTTNRRSRRVSDGDGQLSLLAPELQERHSDSAAGLDMRGNRLSRPTQPTAGKHHANASPTELKAALKVAPKGGTQRAAVLVCVADAPWPGYGQLEIAERTDLLRSSVCARVKELEEGGWVKRSGKTRKTPRGSDEQLYVATARGRDWVAAQRRTEKVS